VALSIDIDDVTDDDDDADALDEGNSTDLAADDDPKPVAVLAKRKIRWRHVVAYDVLPGMVVLLAAAAGSMNWLNWSQGQQDVARTESVRAASDGAVAMLSYRPDTVQNDLDAAKHRLTGAFRDSYSSLVDDVVAMKAIQKLITSVATVPAAASVSASENHAVDLVFVNQTVTVGNDPPSNTNSSVRVTLDKVDGRWLISGFEPI
jgi:Mce-associated membrane protein